MPTVKPRGYLRVVALVLGAVWVSILLVPVVWRLTTGGTPSSMTSFVGLSILFLTALIAGFVFSHAGERRWVAAAAVFGALTAGTAASASVLADQSQDPVPWGAVLLINFLVSGVLTGTAIAIGAVAGSRRHRPRHRTVR